jgi:hypothetical protein
LFYTPVAQRIERVPAEAEAWVQFPTGVLLLVWHR